MQTTNRAEIKATYFKLTSSNWGGIVQRKFQRILIVFSCGPDGSTLRTAARRDDGVCKLNKKPLPRHMILDIQTQLPPPTVCPEGFLWSSACAEKKKERPLFDRNCSTEMHRGRAEMTYKSQHARGCSPTLLLQCVIHHQTMWTGNCLRSTSWHQSKQQYGQNIMRQKSQQLSNTKALKASLWDYVNLIIPFPFPPHSRNIQGSSNCVRPLKSPTLFCPFYHIEMNCLGNTQSEEQRAEGSHYSSMCELTNTWKWSPITLLIESKELQ